MFGDYRINEEIDIIYMPLFQNSPLLCNSRDSSQEGFVKAIWRLFSSAPDEADLVSCVLKRVGYHINVVAESIATP
jgi:hypothetical protein